MFTHHNDRVRRAKWARLVELNGEPERCEICEDQILKANGTSGANWDHDKRLDHLPEADQFRGWLCGSCNRAIGLLKDPPLAALKAAEYLKMHEERRNALLMRYKVAQDEHDMLRCFL